MKSVLLCSVVLSIAGLLCCHELDNSVFKSFDSPLVMSDDDYKIHHIWNNFNDFFKKRINNFERVWSSIFPSDNIRVQNSNEIIYPENLSTGNVEKNVLKRIVRSGNDQKPDQSTESHVPVNVTSNKMEDTTIPKNTTQSKTDEKNVPVNTTQNKTEETSVLMNTGQSVSTSTALNKTDKIFNVSTNITENKKDPSVSMNTTQNSTEPNVNVDKTTVQTVVNTTVNATDLSITSFINNRVGQNATLDQDTKENTSLSSDTSSYSLLRIFSVFALLGLVLGLSYVVYQKQRSRVRNACYQVRDICRDNEETPV